MTYRLLSMLTDQVGRLGGAPILLEAAAMPMLRLTGRSWYII